MRARSARAGDRAQRHDRARAYPLQILIYHEIVNDVFAGRTLDFGTTGKLRRSDHVMYDRQTESWRQQFPAKGLSAITPGQACHHCHRRSYLMGNSAVLILWVKSCRAIQVKSGLTAAIPTAVMTVLATDCFFSLIR